MSKQLPGTRKEWLAACLELLEQEKDLTRRSDEIARRRQDLPWGEIEYSYERNEEYGRA